LPKDPKQENGRGKEVMELKKRVKADGIKGDDGQRGKVRVELMQRDKDMELKKRVKAAKR
jgi:hypothetical protein